MVALLKAGDYSSAELGDCSASRGRPCTGLSSGTQPGIAFNGKHRLQFTKTGGCNCPDPELAATRGATSLLIGRCPARSPLLRDSASLSPRPPTDLRNWFGLRDEHRNSPWTVKLRACVFFRRDDESSADCG